MPRGGGYDVTGLAVKVTREGVSEASRDLKDLATAADKAEREVDQLGKESKQTSNEMHSLGDGASGAAAGFKGMLGAIAGITAAYVAVKKMAEAMSAAIDAAAEQQKIFAGLDIALANTGVSYRSLAGDLDNYFAKLQATTVYGDTDSAEALRFLTVVTGDYGSALKLLEPTLQFSSALHIDIATAARLAGQAATGMTGTLSRYGVILDDATKKQLEMADAMGKATIVSDLLQKKFGGSAQAELETYAGSLKQVGNYWGDLTEAIGDWIVKSEVAPALFAEITDAIRWMIGVAEGVGDAFDYMQRTGDFSDVAQSIEGLKHALDGLGAGVNTENLKVTWIILSSMASQKISSDITHFTQVINALDGALESMVSRGANLRTFTEGLLEGFNRTTEATMDMVASHETVAEKIARINQEVAASLSAIENHKKKLDALGGQAGETAAALDPFLAAMAEEEERLKRGADAATGVTERLDELQKASGKTKEEVDDLSGAMEGLAGITVGPFPQIKDDAIDAFAEIESAFSSMLGKGFTGELDSFGDLWNEVWQDLAKSMIGILGDAFSDLFSGKKPELDAAGNAIPGTGGLFSGGELTTGQRVGMGLGGAGMVYEGMQQGGTGGAIQGALGGAAAGFSIGGPWGAAIGGAVGLIAGLLGGGEDKPYVDINYIGPGPAWQGGAAGVGTRGLDMTAREDRLLSMTVGAQYREIAGSWRDLLRSIGDSDLFDILGSAPELIDQTFQGTAESFSAWLTEDKLPKLFQQQYTNAIKTGLSNLGLTSDAIETLWAEIRDMPGTERLEALGSVISALRQASDMVAMDWEAISVEVHKTAIEQWTDDMNDAYDAMELLTAGWDDMGLVDRADDLEQIGTIFESVTQSTVNMLRQLDQIARTLDASFASIIEGFTTRGMSEDELWSYYNERYNYYNNLLATTDDPNLILEYTQQMLGILNSASGMLTDEQWGSMAGTTGMTWQDWFLSVTQNAQTAADAAVAERQADIQGQYEILWDQMSTTTDRFNMLNNVVEPVAAAFAPLPPLLDDVRDGLVRLRDEMGRVRLGAIS